jgi:excisionase family DNA binding protein
MQERIDAAVVEWAKRIPVDQIPSILAFLAARLLAEGYARSSSEHVGAGAREAEKLLKAGELAERLNFPESWIRNEERLGRIPSVRGGKYVRFRFSDVEQALAERSRQKA